MVVLAEIGVITMTQVRMINLIGWILILFLSISKLFFSDRLSFITSGIGGLICLVIGLVLALYHVKLQR